MNKKLYQIPTMEIIEIVSVKLLTGSTETLDGFLEELQNDDVIEKSSDIL